MIVIKKVDDVGDSTIESVRSVWTDAFGEDAEVHDDNPLDGDTLILVYSEGSIMSVGRLSPIDILFMGKTYSILGIGGVVSVIKDKGWGRKLMTAMKEHLISLGKTGVGFCDLKNEGFYTKCGYSVVSHLGPRFQYKNDKVKDESVLCYDCGEGFLDAVVNSTEKVNLPIPHW